MINKNLILDLNADKEVVTDSENKVRQWNNQVKDFPAQHFVTQNFGREVPGSGRPLFKRHSKDIKGHASLLFDQDELVNFDEDAFDHLITGSGYTWFCVLRPDIQTSPQKDVHAFFGNLRNSKAYQDTGTGGFFEGFWGVFTDDGRVFAGTRNGLAFKRDGPHNPQVYSPQALATDRFHIVGGRMEAGTGKVSVELFVNSPEAVNAKSLKINPKAKSSKMVIGQERDATNHPGAESFKGEITRFLVYERALVDDEMAEMFAYLQALYDLD